MSFTQVGVGHSVIPLTLIGFIFTKPCLIITPKYSTSFWWNQHFSGLRKRLLQASLDRKYHTFSSCSLLSSFVVIMMTSMYTLSHPCAISLWKMSSIMVWKVAGEFVRPKNMTVGSNNPSEVLKAAFHSSPSLIWMLLYPHHTLNLENICFSARSWISSAMSGKG